MRDPNPKMKPPALLRPNGAHRGAFRCAVGWEQGKPGEPDDGAIIPRDIAYRGDPNDKIRIHVMKVRSLSFM